MTHWLQTAWSTYVAHPLHGNGYQWWSGLGSDIGEATIVVALVSIARHHNCHHKGCWLPGHRHPEFGWPSCKRHWHETPAHIDPRQP